MPNKKSFILFLDREKEISILTNEQCGILLKAIFEYARTGTDVEISDPVVRVIFSVFATQIDESAKKWNETCQKRSEAGKKSGESRRNKAEQKRTKGTNVHFVEQTGTKRTDTVTDTVVSVSKDTDTQNKAYAADGAASKPYVPEEIPADAFGDYLV